MRASRYSSCLHDFSSRSFEAISECHSLRNLRSSDGERIPTDAHSIEVCLAEYIDAMRK